MGDEFTNKEIINMIMDLKNEMRDTQAEMRETRSLLKSYNGLREKIMDIELGFATFKQEIMTQNACKKDNKSDWKWILGWVVGIGSLIISVIVNFS